MGSVFPDKATLVEHKVDPRVSYGVEDNMDMTTGEFDYMAGYEVPVNGKLVMYLYVPVEAVNR